MDATLWTGGFPCQDLSVAGKRRGMVAGTRSNLAHAFLDLVERHRPPAIVLENVPGLLSSHGGKDLGALLGRLGELGYGWAYRVLDARHFGVPQRRRRVFIVAFGAGTGLGADGAAEVLSVGSRCRRHPPTGIEAGPDAADGAGDGAPLAVSENQRAELRLTPYARQLTAGGGKPGQGYSTVLLRPAPDAGRVRTADGLARRLDDRDGVVQSLDTKRGGPDDNEAQAGHLIAATLTAPDARHRVVDGRRQDGSRLDRIPIAIGRSGVSDDPFLPLGLDSHRYRTCGNGVVSFVSEWIGERIRDALQGSGL
jgi:DNA (cytosine-5)-methyltransferase 1